MAQFILVAFTAVALATTYPRVVAWIVVLGLLRLLWRLCQRRGF